ncbi:unnamed protein product [Ambrosiozyma monospora]|uniref:Unnamed protein product n=1 Tax=Ambrosiozyma monospora TaxID=43982 RepID=A0ACB5T2V7_AMBMO|nr:unnamed protein product [Ambrosiozyma monospora]
MARRLFSRSKSSSNLKSQQAPSSELPPLPVQLPATAQVRSVPLPSAKANNNSVENIAAPVPVYAQNHNSNQSLSRPQSPFQRPPMLGKKFSSRSRSQSQTEVQTPAHSPSPTSGFRMKLSRSRRKTSLTSTSSNDDDDDSTLASPRQTVSRKASDILATRKVSRKVTSVFTNTKAIEENKINGTYSSSNNPAANVIHSNKDRILPKFEIDFPSKNQIFSPQFNKVKGRVSLKFVDEATKVVSIDIGIKGDIRTHQTNSSKAAPPSQRKRARFDVLFNKSFNAFTSKQDHTDFPEGYILDYPFNLEIPADKSISLPSSCDNFGGTSKNFAAHISVKYELYVRVQYTTTVKKNSTFLDFLVPLKFQGDSDVDTHRSSVGDISIPSHNESSSQLNSIISGVTGHFQNTDKSFKLKDSHVFKEKNKVYLPDRHLGGLIENKMTGGAANYMKKYWDEEQAAAITLCRNMQLSVLVDTPKYLAFDHSLAGIPVKFEVPLSSCNPDDLSFNGMSTKLGYFELESVELSLIQKFRLAVNSEAIEPFEDAEETQLFKVRYPLKPSFDVKDFQIDEQRRVYYKNTTLGEFLKDRTSILDSIKVPIVNNARLGDFFSCHNTIKLVFTIGTGEQQDRKQVQQYTSKRFEFTSPKSEFTYSTSTRFCGGFYTPRSSNTPRSSTSGESQAATSTSSPPSSNDIKFKTDIT